MGIDEIARELGPQVAIDATMAEVLKRAEGMKDFVLSLNQRQKQCTDRMEADLEKRTRAHASHVDQANRVRARTAEILKTLTAKSARVVVATDPVSGQWHIVDCEGIRRLPIFTAPVFAADFIDAKSLDCATSELSIEDFVDRLGKLGGLSLKSVELNACPRCPESFSMTIDDAVIASKLLQSYALMVSTRGIVTRTNLDAALKIENQANRLQALQAITAHIHPGAPSVHHEIVKLAMALGDQALAQHSLTILTKFPPIGAEEEV